MNYRPRVAALAEWLASEGIAAALFVDVEGRRDLNIRYLTGQPGDALLFVLSSGRSVLIPWDINLARTMAVADEMVPYTDYNRSLASAVEGVVTKERISGPLEVSAATPHPVYEELLAHSGGNRVICRTRGIDEHMSAVRMRKDDEELALIDRAAAITNELLELLGDYLTGAGELSEVDVALFLEREARNRGAEGMAFDSLVAGPARSFGIHAFPTYTSAPFGDAGMSILDFGVLVDGYPSDVTVTVLRGTLDPRQLEMVELVQQAYEKAVSMALPGAETRAIAAAVDELFATKGYRMPHALGHGLGLEVHEGPPLRNRADSNERLESGMVLTIEPGLYDPDCGGVRLENDLVVGEDETRIITTSHLLHLP